MVKITSDFGTEEEKRKLERYSFSKISSWWTCPYGYKLKYIDHKKGIGNAFSSYGTLVHSLLERYARGEIELEDLADIFEWEFDTAVPEKFPWNKFVVLRDSYYKQGVDFLNQFEGYDGCEILGVEQEFEMKIDRWLFMGIIDILYKDPDGNLVIRDYKSKASFKNDAEKQKYARQLYLYSLYVKDKYGKYPDRLEFLMFRKQTLIQIPFDHEALEEAVEWAVNTVNIIESAFDYPATCDDFYGQNLCNHREYCDLKPAPVKRNYKGRKG